MKIGVMQGRLQPPVNGEIQEFPQNWEREFEILKTLNLNHIEWIITSASYKTNPIFHRDLSKLPIHSVCCDHLIDEKIANYQFLQKHLLPVCLAAADNDIYNVEIPLLEKSSLEQYDKQIEFSESILKIHEQCKSITISFEAELDCHKIKELLTLNDRFRFVYDTGNITSYSNNHVEYINSIFDKISNVHLKDRNFLGKTVTPMTGDTDFKLIFGLLKKYNYTGAYTLQTARGQDGFEADTISEHERLLREIYEQSI